MPLKLSNNAIGTLVSSMTDSSTSVVLAPGQGAKFPVLGSGDWFPITVVRASNPNQFEIMHATARSGDVLTVTRAREGTTAITFSVGDIVEHRLTRDAMDRDFVRLGPDSLDGVRVSVADDGSDLKTTVHANDKEEQLARQKDIDALGTAALRDLIASAVDTTGGRIPTVGWLGHGSAPIPISDWDDATINGAIYIGESADHAPRQATFVGVAIRRSQNFVTQVLFDINDSNMRQWTRNKIDGNWQDWAGYYHSRNLPLSQSTGQNTNQIMSQKAVTDALNEKANQAQLFGAGQFWQNLTESRNPGTTYTNTTGRAIEVKIYSQTASETPQGLNLAVNQLTIDSVFAGGGSGISRKVSVGGVVPPGGTYRCSVPSGQIERWSEFRS